MLICNMLIASAAIFTDTFENKTIYIQIQSYVLKCQRMTVLVILMKGKQAPSFKLELKPTNFLQSVPPCCQCPILW